LAARNRRTDVEKPLTVYDRKEYKPRPGPIREGSMDIFNNPSRINGVLKHPDTNTSINKDKT